MPDERPPAGFPGNRTIWGNNGTSRAPVAAALDDILSSAGFARSERLQGFLRFVVNETLAGREINEYRIATEVYRRKPSFDPASDSIVRVEAGRLRQKLAEYYRSEAVASSVVIELPQRTYVPVFREKTKTPDKPPQAAAVAVEKAQRPVSPWRSPRRIPFIAASIVLLASAMLSLRLPSDVRWPFGKQVPIATAKTISIAVLPFLDISESKDQAYFGDGLAEEVMDALSHIPGLSVISRTSSFAYRGRANDIRSIGKELNATVILEGSVRRHKSRLRITAQLIDAANGYHLWSQTYERFPGNPFAVEQEIATGIAKALSRALVPGNRQSGQSHYAPRLQTYNLYLQGLHYSRQWSAQGLGKAVRMFEQAVGEDPNFAAAWAALAETRCVLGIHAGFPPNETMPKAKADALKALELDTNLSGAHASLALVKAVYEWDWRGAEKEFGIAHELDAADPSIHEAYIMGFLVPTGRLDEALKQATEARNLDPVSARIGSVAGLVHYFRHEYDQAMVVFQKTLELEPNFYAAHLAIGSVYEEKGMFEQAVAEFRTGRAAWESGIGRAALAYTYARMGKEEEARDLLKELTELSGQRYISSPYIAQIHLALGEKALALDWLDKAYEQRSSGLAMLKVNPRYDSLRKAPRFIALLRKIGLD